MRPAPGYPNIIADFYRGIVDVLHFHPNSNVYRACREYAHANGTTEYSCTGCGTILTIIDDA